MEKRRNCSSGAISPLFYNISNISLNFRSQITYSFVKCGCSIYCFPQFCKSDMSRYAYRKLFQSPIDFEIMRVDCIYTMRKQGCHTALEKIKNDNLRSFLHKNIPCAFLWNCLAWGISMSIHNTSFGAKIKKNITLLTLNIQTNSLNKQYRPRSDATSCDI